MTYLKLISKKYLNSENKKKFHVHSVNKGKTTKDFKNN